MEECDLKVAVRRWLMYLTIPALWPRDTAWEYCCWAFSFSFTMPSYSWPSITLRRKRLYLHRSFQERLNDFQSINTPLPYVHFKFTDEGIFGNTDVELDFFWLLHAICHAACDDGDGIATGHSGVDVVAVNVPVFLKNRRYLWPLGNRGGKKVLLWQAATERSKDQTMVGGVTKIWLV